MKKLYATVQTHQYASVIELSDNTNIKTMNSVQDLSVWAINIHTTRKAAQAHADSLNESGIFRQLKHPKVEWLNDNELLVGGMLLHVFIDADQNNEVELNTYHHGGHEPLDHFWYILPESTRDEIFNYVNIHSLNIYKQLLKAYKEQSQ